jgi:hypothetical protein
MPALDISTDGIFVANASGNGVLTKDQKIFNLNQALETTGGAAISGSRYVLAIFGAVNKNTGECKLWVNLPDTVYSTDEAAYQDVASSVSTSVDTSIYSVAFLICKLPLRHQTTGSGTITFINPAGKTTFIDLRGAPLGISGTTGGGSGGASNLNELSDVAVTTPAYGHALRHNGLLWVNKLIDGKLELFPGGAADDDATTTLDIDSAEKIQVKGGANNHTIALGDATTYVDDVGDSDKRFIIENGSSEMLIVRSGATTGTAPFNVFEFVPPMTTLTVSLLTNATADGTWFVSRQPIFDLTRGYEEKDDFINWDAASVIGWLVAKAGTGTNVGATIVSGVLGTIVASTGSTATAYSTLRSGRQIPLGDGSVLFRTRVAISALSTAVDEYATYIGIHNGSTSAPSEGIYFKYDRLSGGDFWQIVVNNGTENTSVTAIAPGFVSSSTMQTLTFVISSNGARVDFWIGMSHVGKLTANIPTKGTELSLTIQKSVGINGAALYSDFVAISANTDTRRI